MKLIHRFTPVRCASFFAPIALAGSLSAWQVPGPSAPGLLFVPDNRVPLSEYVAKNQFTATMHVEPGILQWICDHSGAVQVAVRKPNGAIVFPNATTADCTTGLVTLGSSILGTCVAVTSWTQELPIVTHWDKNLHPVDPMNPGGPKRGGQSVGAIDGIATIDLDVATGQLVQLNAQAWVTAEADPFVYNTQTYALFDDGSGLHVDDKIPAYEQYIAENYSLYAPTPLAAIWLSDQQRAATGFPVAHRNHTSVSVLGALQDGLPIFQIVHAYIVHHDDPSVPGNEDSLGTFILPPGWSSQSAADSYPILFNGFYDIHGQGTFGTAGEEVLKTLGELYNHTGSPRRAVAILWNGGGSGATLSTQGSAYDNCGQLITDAANLLKADPARVVFMGGSRGGNTAIRMASNPLCKPYTAKFVLAASMSVLMGTAIALANPSYPAGLEGVDGATGFRGSWKTGWTFPCGDPPDPRCGLSGVKVGLTNLFGTSSVEDVDSQLSPDSYPFRAGLAVQGTQVILRYGTNDAFRSYEQGARYFDHLRSGTAAPVPCPSNCSLPTCPNIPPIPVELDVFYRFGHVSPAFETHPTNTDLLNYLFDVADGLNPPSPVTPGVRHFGHLPSDYDTSCPISPARIPLVFENAIEVGAGQFHSRSFVGQPGGKVQFRWLNVGDTGFFDPPHGPPPPSLPSKPWKTLSGDSGAVFGTFSSVNSFATPGWYWYEVLYSPTGDTSTYVTLNSCTALPPVPGLPQFQLPLFYVHPPGPPPDGEQLGFEVQTRTGGLSEDCAFPCQ